MAYRDVTGIDRLKVVGYMMLMILFNVVTAVVLMPRDWPWGFLIWLIVCFCGSLFLLVRWHARVTAYRCPTCAEEFEISIMSDFISPHLPNKKYLKCPHCDEKGWVEVLMKAD